MVTGWPCAGAACMTLELAEFGKSFIISIINGYDMVPTLSASSVHDFISEGRIRRKKILNAARNSITAIGSRLVNRGTQRDPNSLYLKVVMKHKQRTRSLLPWYHREKIVTLSSSKSDNLAEASRLSETSCESFLAEELIITESTTDEEGSKSSSEGSDHDDIDEEEQHISATHNVNTPTVCDIPDDELLNQLKELELETMDDIPDIYAQEKETAITKDIIEEEINDQVVHNKESAGVVTSDNLNRHVLYPPGRIMHIV
ncbi:hypothetical protein CR513_33903, partial [Mucuna pruriens]